MSPSSRNSPFFGILEAVPGNIPVFSCALKTHRRSEIILSQAKKIQLQSLADNVSITLLMCLCWPTEGVGCYSYYSHSFYLIHVSTELWQAWESVHQGFYLNSVSYCCGLERKEGRVRNQIIVFALLLAQCNLQIC